MGKKRIQVKPGLTPKMRVFLAAYEECGSLVRASRIRKVSNTIHYEWLRNSADYRAAFAVSKEIAMGKLEEEARRRAIDGIARKKFYKGDPVIDPETGKQYAEHEYSDALLMFLLRGGMPDVYRDRVSTEVSGPAGTPLQVDHVAGLNLSLLSADELNVLEALANKAAGLNAGDPAGASSALTGPVRGMDEAGREMELASPTVVPDG